jgi:hypothetical protein
MKTLRSAINVSLVTAICIAVFSPHARADADNVSALIDVAIYATNSDYLQFTVHRPKIPQLYVMREVLCRVNLITLSAHRVSKSFQLTSEDPHYFDFEPSDALVYVRTGEPSVRTVTEMVCFANGVYPQLKFSSAGRVPAAPSMEVTGLAASAPGAPSEPQQQLQIKDGVLISSTAAGQGVPGKWNTSGLDFQKILDQLPNKALAEPKSIDIVNRFQDQLVYSHEHMIPEAYVPPKVLGLVPNS